MKIRITADTTCDLPGILQEQHHVALSPLTVLVNDQPHHDGVDVTPNALFHAVEQGGTVKTAAVNTFEYIEFFQRQLEGYDALIHLNIGREFSACYMNACQAAKKFNNVYVVDTGSLSCGQALLVMDAVDMAESGMEPEAIVSRLCENAKLVDGSFVVNEIDYLYRGGRCSGVEAVGAKLLHIRPCIELESGKLHVGKKYRGGFEHCLEHYVLDRLQNAEDIDNSRVFLVHAACDEKTILHVSNLLAQHASFKETHIAVAGSTICTHCGPRTLGIMFKRKTMKQ